MASEANNYSHTTTSYDDDTQPSYRAFLLPWQHLRCTQQRPDHCPCIGTLTALPRHSKHVLADEEAHSHGHMTFRARPHWTYDCTAAHLLWYALWYVPKPYHNQPLFNTSAHSSLLSTNTHSSTPCATHQLTRSWRPTQ